MVFDVKTTTTTTTATTQPRRRKQNWKKSTTLLVRNISRIWRRVVFTLFASLQIDVGTASNASTNGASSTTGSG